MLSINRRTLLIGGGAGVGLVVAVAMWPGGIDSDLAIGPGERSFGPFIKIGKDGRVTVAVAQTETGQGIWTSLPQIVADELGAAWEMVAVEPAPMTAAYANPLAEDEGWLDGFGLLKAHRLNADGAMRITAGSTSIRAFEQPMRMAAATARAMLVGAAADRWNVIAGECDAADGFVFHSGQSFTFGELAEEAAGRHAPSNPTLRDGNKGRLIGKPLRRLDAPAKANGSLRFASDVRLPDMLFASARIAPPGGRLRGFARDAVRSAAGVRHVTSRGHWVAVVADSWILAERALAAANPTFEAPSGRGVVRDVFDAAMASGKPQRFVANGDYRTAVEGRRPVAATYFAAPSQHLWLEPVSATARWTDGRAELWAGTQAAGFLNSIAGDGRASLYPLPVGGPSGRAMEDPVAPIAVELARELKRPVQVILPHHATQNLGPVSAGALARMNAVAREDGIPAAWRTTIVTGNALGATLDRLASDRPDGALDARSLAGATPPYAIEHLAIDGIAADLPYATGYMRGSPEREACFFTESFVDELARRKGAEPLAFRMTMLGQDPRLARCFQTAAALANWDGGGAGSSMGIAGCSAYGSSIALVASASIGADQHVAVHRLVAAIDCGSVVNSGLATQQVEAALMWALAQATVSSPEWVGGLARSRSLTAAGVPKIGGIPEIVVQFLPSAAAPGGLSGLGTLPVAPAIANAIHAATGKRMRDLPFDPMAAA